MTMDVEMTTGELKGRLCSSRSSCAIAAASGHLLCCLPGDCRCPWQPSPSQSTSASRWSLKLPAEPSWGCPGAGRTRRAQGRAGGLARAVPVCHLTLLHPHPAGTAVCWAPPHLGAGTQTDTAGRSFSAAFPGSEMG